MIAAPGGSVDQASTLGFGSGHVLRVVRSLSFSLSVPLPLVLSLSLKKERKEKKKDWLNIS